MCFNLSKLIYDDYKMLSRKIVSRDNKQLFVKNTGTQNVNDLDTELNVDKLNAETMTENDINNYINKLDIPKNNFLEPDMKKQKQNFKEWRWRILSITNKLYAEISYCELKTKKRFYMSGKTNNWEEQSVNPIFDKYVKKEYYCYT
jgi:hypothetical protein